MPGWSAGTGELDAPQLDERAAFKVCALWERRKGPFRPWAALTQGEGNPEIIATVFNNSYERMDSTRRYYSTTHMTASMPGDSNRI